MGVGGPCSAFNAWQLLSTYTDDDLKDLRELAERGGGRQTASITLLSVVLVVMVGFLSWI